MPPAAQRRARRAFRRSAPSSRTLSANTSRPARRTRQRSAKQPLLIASPMAARPNTTASAISSEAPSARSTSMRRDSRARSNRMVSCGSQASRAPSPTVERDVHLRVRARASDRPFPPPRCRRSGSRRADRDVDGEAVAAGHAAGGVDDHRFQRFAVGIGKAHAQRTIFMHCVRRVRPPHGCHRAARCVRSRGWRRRSRRCCARLRSASCRPPTVALVRAVSNRHRPLERGFVHGRPCRRNRRWRRDP